VGNHQLCTQLWHHCLEQMPCQLVQGSTAVALQAKHISNQLQTVTLQLQLPVENANQFNENEFFANKKLEIITALQ